MLGQTAPHMTLTAQLATIHHNLSARRGAHVLTAVHGFTLASSSKVKVYGACIPGLRHPLQ